VSKVTLASKQTTLSAEIMWAMKVITSHYSYKSCTDISKLFTAMFPDSKVAASFTCGPDKVAYLAKYGIAPFFTQQLIENVKLSSDFVVLFDESLNDTME
jgi:hypothetical protein